MKPTHFSLRENRIDLERLNAFEQAFNALCEEHNYGISGFETRERRYPYDELPETTITVIQLLPKEQR